MTEISDVSICNMALGHIGDQRITSLDDNTEAAKACNAFYAILRDEVTQAYPWNFAITRVNLASTATVPVYEYTNTFNLPTNPWCLRVLEVQDFTEREWTVEGRKLLVNASSVNIRYIKRLENPGDMTPLFASALSLRLAASLAVRLTEDLKKQAQMWKLYTAVRREARIADSQEGAPPVIKSTVFAEARS